MSSTIRPAVRDDWQPAMALAWDTYIRFDAVGDTPEGVALFRKFLDGDDLHQRFGIGGYDMIVAEEDGALVGLITVRDSRHISLLFVQADHQKTGIGRRLIAAAAQMVITQGNHDGLTVNATPSAAEFYHRNGFVDTALEQLTDGIRYIPMKKLFESTM